MGFSCALWLYEGERNIKILTYHKQTVFYCRLLHRIMLKHDHMRMLPYSTTGRPKLWFYHEQILENNLKTLPFPHIQMNEWH